MPSSHGPVMTQAQGVLSLEKLALRSGFSPRHTSPRPPAELNPSFSPLFSCSCRSSSSPRPTRPRAPIPRRKGPPGARPASGPRVSGLVLRYFCACPQIHPDPQVGSEGYNLQLCIRGYQVHSTSSFPPHASRSPCS